MIQFREIVLTAKHLQRNFSRECLLFACFSILHLEKTCINCAKYCCIFLQNIVAYLYKILLQNCCIFVVQYIVKYLLFLNNILLAKKSFYVSKKKSWKFRLFWVMQLHITAYNFLNQNSSFSKTNNQVFYINVCTYIIHYITNCNNYHNNQIHTTYIDIVEHQSHGKEAITLSCWLF